MERSLQRPLNIENCFFVRIKGSDTYIHFRYRQYIFKPTARGACMFESTFADDYIHAEKEYELEKILVKEVLQK